MAACERVNGWGVGGRMGNVWEHAERNFVTLWMYATMRRDYLELVRARRQGQTLIALHWRGRKCWYSGWWQRRLRVVPSHLPNVRASL